MNIYKAMIITMAFALTAIIISIAKFGLGVLIAYFIGYIILSLFVK